jgi:hypothetical protein
MTKRILILIASLVLLIGCSVAYKGPRPGTLTLVSGQSVHCHDLVMHYGSWSTRNIIVEFDCGRVHYTAQSVAKWIGGRIASS